MKAKRITALLLCIALLAGLTACGKPAEDSGEELDPAKRLVATPLSDAIYGSGDGIVSFSAGGTSFDGTICNAGYVMIYNPLLYDEALGEQSSSRSSGTLGEQIVSGFDYPVFPSEIVLPPVHVASGCFFPMRGSTGTGGGTPAEEVPCSVGDTRDFICFDSLLNERSAVTLSCLAAGEHACVWAAGENVSAENAQALADEFDRVIYGSCVSAFGADRITANGGKVHLLCYPMETEMSCIFTGADAFVSGELAETNGCNVDCAVLHLNSNAISKDLSGVFPSLAHEYQHMISAGFSLKAANGRWTDTWIDESMSAFAEELTYPGSMNADSLGFSFYHSRDYRHGCSLYHFDTDGEDVDKCGGVFLFEKYLRSECPDFSFRTLNETRAANGGALGTTLRACLSDSFCVSLDERFPYPAGLTFLLSSDDALLSKLTLSFYLNAVDPAAVGLSGYADPCRALMLYDGTDAVEIEGGGRIFVKTQDGTFTLPEDAGKELLYAAFDSEYTLTGLYSAEGSLFEEENDDPEETEPVETDPAETEPVETQAPATEPTEAPVETTSAPETTEAPTEAMTEATETTAETAEVTEATTEAAETTVETTEAPETTAEPTEAPTETAAASSEATDTPTKPVQPQGSDFFRWNNESVIVSYSLNADTETADCIASGIADALHGLVPKTEAFADHAALIARIEQAVGDARHCGLILVFLNDRSYTVAGLEDAVAAAVENGIAVMLINSSVPEQLLPWTVTYDYSGIAATYAALSRYKNSELVRLGTLLGEYVATALKNGIPTALCHEG